MTTCGEEVLVSLLACLLACSETAGLPVNRFVVAFVGHDLGREVIGRAAERPRLVRHALGETKVCDLEMAVPVEQQVFRLQVTVDDVPRVQILERQRDFGSVELGHGVREALDTRRQ